MQASSTTGTKRDDAPTLLRKEDVCSQLTISSRTLEGMVLNGTFPAGVQLGRQKFWSELVVQAWLRRRFAAQETWQPRRGR